MEKWINKNKEGITLVNYCLINNQYFTVDQARKRLQELESITSTFVKCLAFTEIEELKKQLRSVQS